MNVPIPTATVRTLNELDHVRIAKLVDAGNPAHAHVQALLDNADLVAPSDMAPDVVTMRSRVRVADEAGATARELTLAYPSEADAAQGQVSVLSPIGTALLGARVGEVAHWALPDGRAAALRVEALLFQPEASGEYLR
ncbi:nucleoside diphosphate kinase regulator [Pseudorhodoferax sp. LjRoot39]|uniref:nucleoside diphosphate kinase regulator n=1 Tax=Pseudorhodoferax sp. LjRoot39 TaxID=3342328 RepID=UPI003ECCD91B